jgi:dihydrofolate synthase/folylpolyglutamate synthase
MHQAIAQEPAYQASVQLLAQFERFGVDLGLDRIVYLLERLGNPQRQVPIIHVAGSNGKGSVCACLSAVLIAAGYRVGRYTSPHLVHWGERISIQDQPIPFPDLYQVVRQVQDAIDPSQPSPTQFEVITAAAWLYFAQQRVDIAVMEVGLGGRLDATNVCDRPLVSVITSLSLEHWQRLGPTLADIAREKAGILKPNCPAVMGPLPPAADAVVRQRVADLDCPAVWVSPGRDRGDGWADYCAPAGLADPPTGASCAYPLPLPGDHQCSNTAVVLAALQMLHRQGWHLTYDHVVQGLQQVAWPARLQWIEWQGCQILIDGAHNPAGAVALRQAVDAWLQRGDRLQAPIHWVFGALSTKDYGDMLRALLRPGDRLWVLAVPGHASADPQAVADLAVTLCPDLDACHAYDTPTAGLQAAIVASQARHPQRPAVVLCGSLYLIGDLFQTLNWPLMPPGTVLREPANPEGDR